jgi:hypothetical protein
MSRGLIIIGLAIAAVVSYGRGSDSAAFRATFLSSRDNFAFYAAITTGILVCLSYAVAVVAMRQKATFSGFGRKSTNCRLY